MMNISFTVKNLTNFTRRIHQLTAKFSSHHPIKKEKYTPRRAILYVPGHDERKIKKISSLNVDCAVLDCEDGVAINKKEEARNIVKGVLDDIEFGRTECAVRINSVDSGLAEDDISVIFKAGRLPPTIMVPKVNSAEHVEWIAKQLKHHLKSRSLPDKLNLVLFVESAQCLLNLRDICAKAIQLSEDAPFTLDGLVFGSDDFCADIGATRTPEASELLMARQMIVLVAKSFHIQAIDVVYINYKDLDGLKKQAAEGAIMGFTGKQVIHPGQVPIVQEAFSPSPEKIRWAKELIQLFKEHQKSGKGAFTYNGAMIDKPLLLQAQNVVHLAEAIGSQAKKKI